MERNIRVPASARRINVGIGKHLSDGSAFVNFNTMLRRSGNVAHKSGNLCKLSTRLLVDAQFATV
jgi:hypothetical protein